MTPIHAPFAKELGERKCHLTRLRQQIDPTHAFLKSGAAPFWEKADIGAVIMSLRPFPSGYYSLIGIYRRFDAPLFNERDSQLAHIVLSNVPELHQHGLPEEHAAQLIRLAPRERMTLDLLVQGYTRAEIARHLEISLHTANDYAKSVFEYFEVHSQAALIARFRRGDGGHE